MAVSNFIPTIWAALLLQQLETRLVGQAITNQDYSGDASGGSVKITSAADPVVGNYTPGSDITIGDVSDNGLTLPLDQAKYFAFNVDDVDASQSVDGGQLIQTQTVRGSYQLRRAMDSYLLGLIAAGASASNPDHQVAEKTINTAAGAYDELVAWSVLLDNTDTPEYDRWAVVTPAFHGLLLKDSRFVATGDAAAASSRANGMVGQAAGFTIYKSTNLPDGAGAGAGKAMLAGYRGAVTSAVQINSIEAARMEKRFADLVKGLTTYGGLVTRPKNLVSADVIVA